MPYSAGLQWKFLGSLYFCTVVITTIGIHSLKICLSHSVYLWGYGHSTPNTVVGKLFCMLFAVVGIPLGLIMFQSVGERINNLIRIVFIKALFSWMLTEYDSFHLQIGGRSFGSLSEVKSRHLIFISSTIGNLTILIGTLVFHSNETWSIFDAFYYCVITRMKMWIIILLSIVLYSNNSLDYWIWWFRSRAKQESSTGWRRLCDIHTLLHFLRLSNILSLRQSADSWVVFFRFMQDFGEITIYQDLCHVTPI